MKYIHGFLSSRLKEEKISHDESLVIRYLLNFINSNKMEKVLVNGEFYYWVKYEKVATDLEILGVKKQAISDMLIYDLGEKPSDWEERLNSMKESSRKKKMKSKFIGIFKRYTKKDAEGTKSYFAPTEKLYSLLPSITEDDEDMKNKKAPTLPQVEAEEIKPNKSICNSDINNTSFDEKNQCKKVESEVVKIINKSCVNIRKQDLKDCEEEFTDIDKLKEALSICEKNNSHGIKSLRMAYKYGNRNNDNVIKKQGTLFMADSKVIVDGKLKSVSDMTDEEIEQKIREKWGRNFVG
ncbi:hypothetical protein [uncultured Clostridium sp.]|jgi:hypothetical protein|uniref:hypothetical protein n=1 Tax=uncultured Clostridium sp. TaxID=59620 RepID=UPI0025D4515C|nr:hypothetical protein [uncultured Clostridium sp.]